MKVLMTKPARGIWPDTAPFFEDLRTSFPEVDIKVVGTVEEQLTEVKDADVYYGWISRDVFLAADRLRWVHCPGVGVDRLMEIDELVESDVVLTNSPGPHANVMADHVMGMVVALAHRFGEMWDDQRAHHWGTSKYTARYAELSGSTMGILALGEIGMAVAARAHAFNMDVYGVDKHPKPPPPVVKEVWGLERLNELMSISDWFVVAVPYTTETDKIIDAGRFAHLKEGAHVIVISRGGIVDEDALIQGLRSGRIAGAGIDATEVEPLPGGSPLWDLNTIISPHSSASSPEMYEGRQALFKENLRRFLANQPFIRVCDKRAGF
jgi:phosphoglycerate dehydrogenase-like enzyme